MRFSHLSMSKPAVGFVGLGAMGFGMAIHLVKEGYPVHGFDISPASVQRFQEAGGIPAASLKGSATDKAFYICMVAAAPQVQSVFFGEDGIVQCGHTTSKYIEIPLTRARPPAEHDSFAVLHGPSDVCSIRRQRARISRSKRHFFH